MKLLIGVPTYDGLLDFQLPAKIHQEIHGHADYAFACHQSSLLAHGFNTLYCMALNHRPECQYFLLWHADVRVISGEFVSGIIAEMERVKAHCLTVLLPIKDGRGVTSSGLLFEKNGELKRRRLTMSEAGKLPETFNAGDLSRYWQVADSSILLANTGLMLLDLRPAWAEKLYFTIKDRIVKGAEGKFRPLVESEDWGISRQLRDLGGSVYITRKFQATHRGTGLYSNQGSWGSWQYDQEWESPV